MNTAAAQVLEESALETLEGFIGAYAQEFQPFAYWDKHLDCIRVQTMDCSVVKRLNRFFTVLSPLHGEWNDYVGFTIKGWRFLCEEADVEPRGMMSLVDILDSIVKAFPDRAVKLVREAVSRNDAMRELSVDFAAAA